VDAPAATCSHLQDGLVPFVLENVPLLAMCLRWYYEPPLLYDHPLRLDIANPIRTLRAPLRPRPMRSITHEIAKNKHSKTTKIRKKKIIREVGEV
jgi:hypothetical protein